MCKHEFSLSSSIIFYSNFVKSNPKWWGTLKNSEIYFTHESYIFTPVELDIYWVLLKVDFFTVDYFFADLVCMFEAYYGLFLLWAVKWKGDGAG